MSFICDNCDRTSWDNYCLTCLCGKKFCSQECQRDWHNNNKHSEKFRLDLNEEKDHE